MEVSFQKKGDFIIKTRAFLGQLCWPKGRNGLDPEALHIYQDLKELMKLTSNFDEFKKRFDGLVMSNVRKYKLENNILAHTKLKYCNSFCDYIGNLIEQRLNKIREVIKAMLEDVEISTESQQKATETIVQFFGFDMSRSFFDKSFSIEVHNKVKKTLDSIKDKKLSKEKLNEMFGLNQQFYKKISMQNGKCEKFGNLFKNLKGDTYVDKALNWLDKTTKPLLNRDDLYKNLHEYAKSISERKHNVIHFVENLEQYFRFGNNRFINDGYLAESFINLYSNYRWYNYMRNDVKSNLKTILECFEAN